jgi:hypothetical protein
MQGPEYAVFTELSPDNKAMSPGFNTRVFTDVDSQRGNSIRCDFKTGAITLAPGSYHITGFSMATYNSGTEPPEMTTVRSPAAAGYCRLRTYDPKATVDPSNMRFIPNEDPRIICIGSPCTPNMTPSLFEAYYTTEKEVQIILEHQMGHAPGQDLPSRLHREFEMACLCQNRHPPDLTSGMSPEICGRRAASLRSLFGPNLTRGLR